MEEGAESRASAIIFSRRYSPLDPKDGESAFNSHPFRKYGKGA